MNPKTNKKAIRTLVSFIIAFALIGIPATLFVPNDATAAPNFNDVVITPDPIEIGQDADLEVLVYDPDGMSSVTWKLQRGTPDGYGGCTWAGATTIAAFGDYFMDPGAGNLWTDTIGASN
ncbi:MAG: hypothetical protein ACP5FL_06915, partial [Thermoplasmatota archaeon]